MRPELYSRIVLMRDVPEADLLKGDVATLIDYLDPPAGGEPGALLEVFNVVGESIDVVAVPVSAIEALSARYLPAARPIEPA